MTHQVADLKHSQNYHPSAFHKTTGGDPLMVEDPPEEEDFLEEEDSPEEEDFLEEADTLAEEEYHPEDHLVEDGDHR